MISAGTSSWTGGASGGPEVTTVVLSPGDFHFGGGSLRISTLLGSCVAITLWHPQLRIGGMCHYLLPRRRDAGWNGAEDLDGRYADEAVHLFQRRIEAARTAPGDYQVKVFGGAHQFFTCGIGPASDIPQRNLQAAHELLADWGLPVLARHVGGAGPRQVMLDLPSGDVWVRHTPQPMEAG